MEIKKENYITKHEGNVIETMSLEDLQSFVDHMVRTAKMNNKRPCDIPVYFINDGLKYEMDRYSGIAMAFSSGGETEVDFEFSDYYRVEYVAPDSRPEEGEYWKSRGVGYDLSGFVKSKAAGERLRRMVRLVLEKDEIKSWLDYREREPNWIQFKFQKEEFDLDKLDEMARDNHDVLTIDILKQCKVTK